MRAQVIRTDARALADDLRTAHATQLCTNVTARCRSMLTRPRSSCCPLCHSAAMFVPVALENEAEEPARSSAAPARRGRRAAGAAAAVPESAPSNVAATALALLTRVAWGESVADSCAGTLLGGARPWELASLSRWMAALQLWRSWRLRHVKLALPEDADGADPSTVRARRAARCHRTLGNANVVAPRVALKRRSVHSLSVADFTRPLYGYAVEPAPATAVLNLRDLVGAGQCIGGQPGVLVVVERCSLV